jgi:hypothetical protein
MSEFIQPENLDIKFEETFCELGITDDRKELALSLLKPLKEGGPVYHECYNHCIRVGILAKEIGAVTHSDERALFYAGIFHDIGKINIDPQLLGKTDIWTEEDRKTIQEHVQSSYQLLCGKFDFSAEIIQHHHQYQSNPYPEKCHESLHQYSKGSEISILKYARILSLADSYDALHRKNSFFGKNQNLTDQEIEDKMLSTNPDQKQLIEDLYHIGVFINSQKTTETNRQKELYKAIWTDYVSNTPKEISRRVMLAAALEPVGDKTGNTTRFNDISRFIKLEHFITAGINLGSSFEELVSRVQDQKKQPQVIYDLALKAQKDSNKNRRVGRVNQGMIEIFIPIVVGEQLALNNDIPTILENATEVLKNTSFEDINFLIKMKEFAFELSNYTNRKVPLYPEAKTVYDYYHLDFQHSTNPTSLAHNGEFINGFPTVSLIYKQLSDNLSSLSFFNAVTEAYKKALKEITDKYHDVGRGFIADCIAVGIYLYLSQNPQVQLVK